MPIYEYVCSSCGHAFEHLARTRQDKPEACPACGAKKLRKQLSTFAPPVTAATAPCHSCAGEGSCASPGSGACGCMGACGCHS